MRDRLSEIYMRIAYISDRLGIMNQAEFDAAEAEIVRLEAEAFDLEEQM